MPDNKKNDTITNPQTSAIVQNEDYYFNEQGLMVMTEKYHLKRGFCCKNKCQHCPFEFKTSTSPNAKT